MPWGQILGNVAGAVITSAFGGGDSGGSASAAADPFASQRGQYQTMLAQMMGVPSTAATTYAADGSPNLPYGVSPFQWAKSGGGVGTPSTAVGGSASSPAPASGFSPNDHSYAWRYKQGLQATDRAQAAMGGLNSGGRLTALTDYGQNQASTEYANQFSRLAQLAGANVGSPAAAGQIIAGQTSANNSALGTFGSQLGKAAYDWFSAPATVDPSTFITA